MSVLNIRVPLEEKQKLERRAAAAGVPVSEIVRQAIETSQGGGVWVAYYPAHLSASLAIPFSTEVEALRHALEHGSGHMQVKLVPFGSDIYDETKD